MANYKIERIELVGQEPPYYDQVREYFLEPKNVFLIHRKQNDLHELDWERVKRSMPKGEFRPNLYGLLMKRKDEEFWSLKYIGQRKYSGILQRLRSHLIYRSENTGSQYEKVKQAMGDGFEIAIKLIGVHPDYWRQAYEAKLIEDIKPKWNIHG